MAGLFPDTFLSSVLAVDFDELERAGVHNLLMDMDNTLLPRRTYTIPPEMKVWIQEARDRGFRLGVISNNWHQTVFEVAATVDLPVVWKAMKPMPFAFIHARRRFGFARRETIVIGDQLITDIWGAHCSGMKSILVLPLVSYDLPHTLILRKVEKLFIGGMSPIR